MIDRLLDVDMQRCGSLDLNRGEADHAPINALRIGRQGEIRAGLLENTVYGDLVFCNNNCYQRTGRHQQEAVR